MNNPKTSDKYENVARKKYCLITALLGWLGAVNSLLIGLWVLITCLELSQIPPMKQLLFQAYGAFIVMAISAFALIYGSYVIWKTSRRKGGIINLFGGLTPIPVYVYFTLLSQPALKPTSFWPLEYVLLAPAIISGTIATLKLK